MSDDARLGITETNTNMANAHLKTARDYARASELLRSEDLYKKMVSVSDGFILSQEQVIWAVRQHLEKVAKWAQSMANSGIQRMARSLEPQPDTPNIEITPKGEQALQAQAVVKTIGKKAGKKAGKKPAKKAAARSPARRKPAKATAAKKPARKSSTASWRAARKAAVKKLAGNRRTR